MGAVWRWVGVLAVLVALSSPAAASARFSFLVHPTDQLGVPGYVSGTTVLARGLALHRLGGARVPLRAAAARPTTAPVRTLLGGRFPAVRYSLRAGSVRYTVSAFSARPGQRPVNFVRVVLRNLSRHMAAASWAVALRHSGGALKAGRRPSLRFRVRRSPRARVCAPSAGRRVDRRRGVATGAGERVTRDGDTLLLLPSAPAGLTRRLLLRPAGAKRPVREDTLFGEAIYRGELPGHARRRLDFTAGGPGAAGRRTTSRTMSPSTRMERAELAAARRCLLARLISRRGDPD